MTGPFEQIKMNYARYGLHGLFIEDLCHCMEHGVVRCEPECFLMAAPYKGTNDWYVYGAAGDLRPLVNWLAERVGDHKLYFRRGSRGGVQARLKHYDAAKFFNHLRNVLNMEAGMVTCSEYF